MQWIAFLVQQTKQSVINNTGCITHPNIFKLNNSNSSLISLKDLNYTNYHLTLTNQLFTINFINSWEIRLMPAEYFVHQVITFFVVKTDQKRTFWRGILTGNIKSLNKYQVQEETIRHSITSTTNESNCLNTLIFNIVSRN